MPERILIIDDSPADVAALLCALRSPEYCVSVSPGGPQAIALAREIMPDIILLSMARTPARGLETCKGLKADHSTAHIPVLPVVGRGEVDLIQKGFLAGAADYVGWPPLAEEAQMRVRLQLELAQLSRQAPDKAVQLTRANEGLAREMERHSPANAATAPDAASLPLNWERAEAMLIQRALAETRGNVARAARLLGINRTKIYRRFHASRRIDDSRDQADAPPPRPRGTRRLMAVSMTSDIYGK